MAPILPLSASDPSRAMSLRAPSPQQAFPVAGVARVRKRHNAGNGNEESHTFHRFVCRVSRARAYCFDGPAAGG